LPADWHTLAIPLEVQVGAAWASGSTAITTAPAPITNSLGTKVRILMVHCSFFCFLIDTFRIAYAPVNIVPAATQ
jgi:hypothetical protein